VGQLVCGGRTEGCGGHSRALGSVFPHWVNFSIVEAEFSCGKIVAAFVGIILQQGGDL
jgi:hypothetical protein